MMVEPTSPDNFKSSLQRALPISNTLTTIVLVAGFCVMGGSVIYRKADIASGSTLSSRANPSTEEILPAIDPDEVATLDKVNQARSFSDESGRLSDLLSSANHPRQISLADIRSNPFRAVGAEVVAQSQSNEERRELLRAAQRLQLCSIDCDDTRRTCTINNTLYREGQTVESFTVEKISPGSVVVKSGMYRFELK